MTTPRPYDVAIATGDAAWESRVVGDLARRPDLQVTRRCVDLADLLATAATVAVHAVLIGPGLHRLDRDALERLVECGVAPVGIAATEDPDRNRLVALGLDVVSADAPVGDIVAALVTAVGRLAAERGRASRGSASLPSSLTDGFAGAGRDGVTDPDATDLAAATPGGAIVAVWGPTGAPGRSTVAVNLAAEAGRLEVCTLLADADTYGASIAQHLALLDEAPGLAAAVRAAGAGGFEPADLVRHARQVTPYWRVLTGISRADRWPELRPAALAAVWAAARRLATLTVIDTGFALERDEELSFDVAAPRRNAATLQSLEVADVVVVVGRADPVGLQRLVRGLDELADAVPGCDTLVVVNRMRRSLRTSRQEITDLLHRFAAVDDVVFVPDDSPGVDAALSAGRPLGEVAPRSGARTAIRDLAARVVHRWTPLNVVPAARRGRDRRQEENNSSRPATV